MRTRRICFATTEYPPHVGGAARSAQRLVRGLARAGFDVVVFSAPWGDQKTSVLPETDDGVPLRWVPHDVEVARRTIEQEDRARQFDLFHGFTLRAAFPCLEFAAQGGRPLVASIRGADGMAFDKWTGEVLRRATWVTSVSSDSVARAATVCGLAGRCSVIPNGVDLDANIAWTPTADNEGVVGTVAAFRTKKNIPALFTDIVDFRARVPAILDRNGR
jgi:glycosyltransferase involved in cell wall biosynthesis